MKTLHWLNKQIAYIMLFLSSQSGSGAILLIVFLFDIGTNALGIQVFFSERLKDTIAKDLGLTQKVASIVSLFFSFFASMALGLSIMQATLHNKKLRGLILSLISVVISIAGLIHVGVSVGHYSELATFSNIVKLVMIAGLGVMPPITYDMNAALVVELFGKTLERFNEASTQELEKSFKAQVKDLGEHDVRKTQAQTAKNKRKYKAPVVQEGKEFDFSQIDFNN